MNEITPINSDCFYSCELIKDKRTNVIQDTIWKMGNGKILSVTTENLRGRKELPVKYEEIFGNSKLSYVSKTDTLENTYSIKLVKHV